MPGTKRIPLARKRAAFISLRAIELFEKLNRAKCEDDRWHLHNQLSDELQIPPHVFPCVPMDADCIDDGAIKRAAALREASRTVRFNGSRR